MRCLAGGAGLGARHHRRPRCTPPPRPGCSPWRSRLRRSWHRRAHPGQAARWRAGPRHQYPHPPRRAPLAALPGRTRVRPAHRPLAHPPAHHRQPGKISALHSGPLALVQPILALELLFVFAYMAILGSPRITVRPRDRLAAVAMSPGSAPFSAWPHLREGGRTHQVAGGIRFGANGEAVGLRIRSSGDPPRYETSRLSSQTANFRPLS
jgi:hypothetical protein